METLVALLGVELGETPLKRPGCAGGAASALGLSPSRFGALCMAMPPLVTHTRWLLEGNEPCRTPNLFYRTAPPARSPPSTPLAAHCPHYGVSLAARAPGRAVCHLSPSHSPQGKNPESQTLGAEAGLGSGTESPQGSACHQRDPAEAGWRIWVSIGYRGALIPSLQRGWSSRRSGASWGCCRGDGGGAWGVKLGV